MKEFFFYLDAWKYCTDHGLPMTNIVRKDWKVWQVIGSEIEMEN
jgi:hypothetical protein